MENLVLDPRIVYTVLVPILFVMVLINVLRVNIHRMLSSSPPPPSDKMDFRDSFVPLLLPLLPFSLPFLMGEPNTQSSRAEGAATSHQLLAHPPRRL